MEAVRRSYRAAASDRPPPTEEDDDDDDMASPSRIHGGDIESSTFYSDNAADSTDQGKGESNTPEDKSKIETSDFTKKSDFEPFDKSQEIHIPVRRAPMPPTSLKLPDVHHQQGNTTEVQDPKQPVIPQVLVQKANSSGEST